MMRQNEDGSWIASEISDFKEWEILQIEDWKPHVRRVHMRNIGANGFGKFMVVYVSEMLAIQLQLKMDG